VLTLLSFARFWARPMDVILPLGFFSLLISNVPMFISFLFLVKLLNNPDESGLTYTQILVPNAVSWLAMWVSGLVIALGLGQKERLRDQLLASGAVWTYHEGVSEMRSGPTSKVLKRQWMPSTVTRNSLRELKLCLRALSLRLRGGSSVTKSLSGDGSMGCQV